MVDDDCHLEKASQNSKSSTMEPLAQNFGGLPLQQGPNLSISHQRKIEFNDLPRELRDKIYGFAVIEPAAIRVLIVGWRRTPSRALVMIEKFIKQGAARVSRSFRNEALAVFLSHNHFYFPTWDSEAVLDYLCHLRPALGNHVVHLRHMCVALDFYFVDYLYHGKGMKRPRHSCEYRIYLSSQGIEIEYDTVTLDSPLYLHFGAIFEASVLEDGACVCDIHKSLTSTMQKAGGYDGGILLDTVNGLLRQADKEFDWSWCEECELFKPVSSAMGAEERLAVQASMDRGLELLQA